MVKVLLAEDQQIVRDGIKNVLENSGRFRVVGEASNGKEALQIIEEGTSPDIIIADVNMPEITGIQLAENLKKTHSRQKIRVVILTTSDNENYVFDAFRAGVKGYLLKNISTEELLFALTHVAKDNQYICSNLAVRILKRADYRSSTESYDIDFSKRETEVLTLIASGYTNKEIADKLFTSRRTVEGHRQTMINKANVRNSAELIRFAVKNSLID